MKISRSFLCLILFLIPIAAMAQTGGWIGDDLSAEGLAKVQLADGREYYGAASLLAWRGPGVEYAILTITPEPGFWDREPSDLEAFSWPESRATEVASGGLGNGCAWFRIQGWGHLGVLPADTAARRIVESIPYHAGEGLVFVYRTADDEISIMMLVGSKN